jgi:hypothetical protein
VSCRKRKEKKRKEKKNCMKTGLRVRDDEGDRQSGVSTTYIRASVVVRHPGGGGGWR